MTMYQKIIDKLNTMSRQGITPEYIELTPDELKQVIKTCPKCLLESLPHCLGVLPIRVKR